MDLTAHKPSSKGDGADTSTSTGGATATRNTGAATGGAVTITISGSSSTGTSTETSTETGGAGKGAAAGKGKGKGAGPSKAGGQPDTGDKRPHVYNITVNSTGQSGHAVDGSGEAKPDEITMKDIKGWTGPQMRAEMKKPGGKERINKALKNRKKPTNTVKPA